MNSTLAPITGGLDEEARDISAEYLIHRGIGSHGMDPSCFLEERGERPLLHLPLAIAKKLLWIAAEKRRRLGLGDVEGGA